MDLLATVARLCRAQPRHCGETRLKWLAGRSAASYASPSLNTRAQVRAEAPFCCAL